MFGLCMNALRIVRAVYVLLCRCVMEFWIMAHFGMQIYSRVLKGMCIHSERSLCRNTVFVVS